MNLFLIVLTFFIGYSESKQTLNNDLRNIHQEYFDILTEDLKSQHWSEDEIPCLDDILRTIVNVQNSTLWATWIWDSNQLPVGQLMGSKHHLGNYDQCLSERIGSSSPPFRTMYCLTDIILRSSKEPNISLHDIDPYGRTEDYINIQTEWDQHFNVMTWGVCVPETCQEKSVKKFLLSVLGQSYLGRLKLQLEVHIENCEVAGEATKHSDGFNIILVAALVMIVVVLTCTKYISTQKVNTNPFVHEIIKCFCLKRNTNDLLASPKNDIKVLNGMRFMSSCIIVLVHTIMICMLVTAGNGLNFETKHLNSYGKFLLDLVIVVDTFFIMSGLLFARNTKADSTLTDLAKMLIKRYFRLIWWYITAQVTIIFVLPRFGCGPLCSRYMDFEQGACIKTWWSGYLMIGNYIDRLNVCYVPSWYIFSDFHLTLMASILFWIHQKNRSLGKICYCVVAFLSILLPGMLAYNAPELGDYPFHFQLYNAMRNVEDWTFFLIYLRTHYRASPYIAGLMVGYIMKTYGAGAFRNTFTKKQLFIYTVAFLSTVVYLSTQGHNAQVMLYIILQRLIWICLISGIIILCECGSLPYVNALLSWSIFVPLSKLTYGIYMVHSILIMYNTISIRSPLHFNGYVLTEKFFGTLTLACFISLFFLLFVESPLNNLVKLILETIGNKKRQEIKNNNGIDLKQTSEVSGEKNKKL